MATFPQDALAELLDSVSLRPTGSPVRFDGAEPVFPTGFPLATAGAAAIAATGVAADELWAARSGRHQEVGVELRHAAAALRSDRYLRINDAPPPSPWADISGFYAARDSRSIQLHCNFPNHRDAVLTTLGCKNDRDAVTRAVSGWDAFALEDALAAAGGASAVVRSRDEWLAHPQGTTVVRLPVLEVLKIGDSPPEPLRPGSRPLEGVRVLEMTRVLAGPVGGRTLAEHGADVMRVTAAHLPGYPEGLDIDTGFGKLSAGLDLREASDRTTLHGLVPESDVFLQSYRPGSLGGRSLGPEELTALRPGLIYVTLSAFGHEGPWAGRRGFDSLLQSASGFVAEESEGGAPRHMPAQALDYVAGYLLAFGAMTALLRRAREGGSYLVRTSLAQTGHWIEGLGRIEGGRAQPDLTPDDIAPYLIEDESPFGRLRHLAPAVQLSETPARWSRPSTPLGSDPARWPARA